MAGGVKVSVKGGRVKAPDLSDPQLKAVGDSMVTEQKKRWSRAINAEGNAAKKLSIKYFMIKRKYRHGGTPVRDMVFTGLTAQNFGLRRAARGSIRAENSTRETRKRANRAQGIEEMIGFAGSDQTNVFRKSLEQYGLYLKRAWVPLG